MASNIPIDLTGFLPESVDQVSASTDQIQTIPPQDDVSFRQRELIQMQCTPSGSVSLIDCWTQFDTVDYGLPPKLILTASKWSKITLKKTLADYFMNIVGQTYMHLDSREMNKLLETSRLKELQYSQMLASAEREHQAFISLKSGLLSRPELRDKYVAVVDGKVEDSDDSDEELVARMYAKFGYRPMYIGLVSEKPKLAMMPTPL